MAYSVIIDDGFSRANTGIGSGANSTNVTGPATYNSPSIGGSYLDALGNVWEISSNTLTAINLNRNNDNGDFSSAFLSRPAAENVRDGQAAITFVPGTAGSATCVLARIVSGVCYAAYVYYASGTLTIAIAKFGPGSNVQSQLTSGTYSGSGTASYILTLSAIGASPTALTATLALASAPGTILQTLTASDSTSALQVAAPWGLSANGASGGMTYTGTISHFTTYVSASAASAITITPTSASVAGGGTQNFTVGLNGTLTSGVTLTVTLATTIGSLNTSTLTFTGTGSIPAAQTVTLNAPGTAGSGNLTGTHNESGGSQTLTDFASVPVMVTVASGTATAITISPSSASLVPSATQTFSVGVNGTLTSGLSLVVNLATTIGTLSTASLTFTGTGGTPATQTVTLTASGSAGTGSLTGFHTESGASQTLADFSAVAVAVATASLVIGTMTATPTQSGITLALSAALSGGSGAGYAYKIYRGTDPNFTAGTALATVSSLPYTDTTASPGVQYYYGIQGSDNASHTVNALPAGLGSWSPGSAPYVSAQVQGTGLNIVFVGDSITYGAGVSNAGTVNSPTMPYFCMTKLKRLLGIRLIYGSNNGISGYTLTDWAPGGSTYAGARSAMTMLVTANATALPIFSVMLGTNDSASSGTNNSPLGAESAAVYTTKLQALVTQMLTDFPACKVFIHLPPWYSPNTQNSSVYLQAGLSLMVSYRAATATVVQGFAAAHPGQVFLGDTYAYQYFAQNYQAEQQADTSGPNGTFYLHPSGTAGSNGLIGTQSLGEMHAQAIAGALLGGIANRWTH